jgi:ribosomal protein S18 acetylase RimI-like enzyme
MADTQSTQIELVPLTRAWLDAVTEIHLQAYKGNVNFSQLLGKAFVRRTYAWFCEFPDRFGFVAIVNGKPVGFIVGAEFAPERQLNRYRLFTALRQVMTKPWLVISRPVAKGLTSRIPSLFRKDRDWEVKFDEDEILSLYSLAVLPEYARYRIANLLLRECEKHAVKTNKKIILTRVGVQNLSSLMVHRLIGYVVDSSKSDDTEKFLYKRIATE